MTWYRTGTIAVTNGSTTVTGTGTAWVANVIAGYGIILPDGRLYEIASIVSNTSLTLRTGYLGATASGQSYAVAPLRGPEVRLAQDIAALINDYGAAFLGAGQGRFAAGTVAAPSVRNAADENTGLNLLGSDQLQLVTNGVARLLLTTSAATLNVPLGGTAVTQSAIDTTAGRLLKVGDAGILGAPPVAPSDIGVTDNTLGRGIWYQASPTVTTSGLPANLASSSQSYLFHHRRTDTAEMQLLLAEFATADADRTLWFRRRTAGAWGGWKRIYDWANILGTVSQASGVPTGAIIERGSNANGQYVRFADGTQICWHRATVSLAIDTAFVGGFRAIAQTWSYSATFSAAPEVVVTPLALTAMSGLTQNAPGTASVNWSVGAVSSQTAADRTVSLIATGRWA